MLLLRDELVSQLHFLHVPGKFFFRTFSLHLKFGAETYTKTF